MHPKDLTTLQLTTTINKCATVDAAAAVVTISTCIETKRLNYRMKRAEIIRSVLRISVTGLGNSEITAEWNG